MYPLIVAYITSFYRSFQLAPWLCSRVWPIRIVWGGGMDCIWKGPYKEVVGKGRYQLKSKDGRVLKKLYNGVLLKEYHSPTATEEDKAKKEKEEQDKGTEGNDGKTTTKDQHTKQDPIDLTSEFVKHRCETLLASRLLRRITKHFSFPWLRLLLLNVLFLLMLFLFGIHSPLILFLVLLYPALNVLLDLISLPLFGSVLLYFCSCKS